jgi:hypothetical protein
MNATVIFARDSKLDGVISLAHLQGVPAAHGNVSPPRRLDDNGSLPPHQEPASYDPAPPHRLVQPNVHPACKPHVSAACFALAILPNESHCLSTSIPLIVAEKRSAAYTANGHVKVTKTTGAAERTLTR